MLDCSILKIDNDFAVIEVCGEDYEFKFPTDLLPEKHLLYPGDLLKLHFFLESEDTSYLDDESSYGGKVKNRKIPKIKNLS